MPKVMIIFGTRPEAIKMAPVVLAFQKSKLWETVVCVTAQHREMLDMVLSAFNIIPQYDLNIMKEKQSLPEITSRVLCEITPVLQKEKPDVVLVHGDTSTTMAAALAAFYEKIPVGHVEAGLRTEDLYIPFPEEMNRRVTDQLCTFWFPPTRRSMDSLIKEGMNSKHIIMTGNTVIDALINIVNRPKSDNIWKELGFGKLNKYRVILVTAHRRESWGEPIKDICKAILDIVAKFPDTAALVSVHPNPIVKDVVKDMLKNHDRICISDHIDYVPFCNVISSSYLVLTDSGGIQEEAPTLGKPVLVMRDVTERPEAVEAGTALLVGPNRERIVSAASKLLGDEAFYAQMSKAVNPYGDGKASERIVQALSYYHGLQKELPDEFVAGSNKPD